MTFQKGHPCYITHHSIKTRRLLSRIRMGELNPAFGKHPSEKTLKKMRSAHAGKNNHFYGKKHDAVARRKMRRAHLGVPLSLEHRKSMSLAQQGRIIPPEVIRKSLARRPVSSLERRMIAIIARNNLPYKFVGNGQFMLGRKCPDFVNCNGEKIALEVFCRKHKEEFRGGFECWMKDRSKLFATYGWKVKYFDETQLNTKNVMKVLG